VSVYFGQFFGNYRSIPKIWATFSKGKVMYLFQRNLDWATFWASFSETHLVTLLASLCRWVRSNQTLSGNSASTLK
jgi:hypothetical protein